MAEFVGGEPISVGVDEPITFENKTDTAFNVGCGIVFRKSGIYEVSVTGNRTIVSEVPKRKTGKWISKGYGEYRCSSCRRIVDLDIEILMSIKSFDDYCPYCGSCNGGNTETE